MKDMENATIRKKIYNQAGTKVGLFFLPPCMALCLHVLKSCLKMAISAVRMLHSLSLDCFLSNIILVF